MLHSRPGFAPRRSDDAVARLNDDMVPALNRTAAVTGSPLKPSEISSLQQRAEAAHEREVAKRVRLDAEAHAKRLAMGPEVLVNPAPTEPPKVLEPGK
jgi:hypothetical protein